MLLLLRFSLPPPAGAPSPAALHTLAAQMAGQLGVVACPPLNAALWLQRYIAELELPEVSGCVRGAHGRRVWGDILGCASISLRPPSLLRCFWLQALLPVALQLHSLYQAAPLDPLFIRRPSKHAWAQLMATLLLTLKLCYGLHGSSGGGDGAAVGLPGASPPPSWPEWAAHQLTRAASLSAFPLTLSEVSGRVGGWAWTSSGTLVVTCCIYSPISTHMRCLHRLPTSVCIAGCPARRCLLARVPAVPAERPVCQLCAAVGPGDGAQNLPAFGAGGAGCGGWAAGGGPGGSGSW